MKSGYKFISVGALLLLIGSSGAAQQRAVIKADFEKLEAIGDAKLEKLSYREKTTKFFTRVGKSDYTSTRIIEHLRPNRHRMVFKDTGDESEGAHHDETIQIGNKEYSREGKGPWKVRKPKAPARMTDIVDERHSYIIDIKDKGEILYLGKENLNGRVANAYRLTMPFIDHKFYTSNRVVKKQWFDVKRRIIRTEVEVEWPDNKQFMRTVTDYEYDIPIKIQAPMK